MVEELREAEEEEVEEKAGGHSEAAEMADLRNVDSV